MVSLIIIPFLNGYNWGYTPFSDIPKWMFHFHPLPTLVNRSKKTAASVVFLAEVAEFPEGLGCHGDRGPNRREDHLAGSSNSGVSGSVFDLSAPKIRSLKMLKG